MIRYPRLTLARFVLLPGQRYDTIGVEPEGKFHRNC